VGVEHVPAQRVHALALVELAGDLAAVVLPGQVAGGVDGTTQRPYSLSAAARVFCRSARDSLPTISDAVTCPYFSDAATRSISSQFSAISMVLSRRVNSGPATG
jgi:hypothetical protein